MLCGSADENAQRVLCFFSRFFDVFLFGSWFDPWMKDDESDFKEFSMFFVLITGFSCF